MSQLIVSDNTFEKIKDFYLMGEGKIILTEHEEEVRKRWLAAFSKMLEPDYITEKSIIPFLQSEFEISESQAYRDIRSAKLLFGDVRKSNKEAMRYLVTEWAKDLFKQANEAKDYDAMSKALDKIIKANNLDKEDMDLPDPSKINPPIQILQISLEFIKSEYFKNIDDKAKEEIQKLLDKVDKILKGNPIKDYLNMSDTEDAEHEELKNE